MPFLDWVNKNQAKASSTQVPYHLLQKEAEYGAPSENMVIQGDNLRPSHHITSHHITTEMDIEESTL